MPGLTLLSPRTLCIYFLYIKVGLLYALVMPTLSLFLSETFESSALAIGLFFVALALTNIFYSQTIASLSDRFKGRRTIIFFGMVCGAIACFAFPRLQSFSLIVITSLTFLSLSFVATSQVLAQSREFSNQYLPPQSGAIFNSVMRACAAFAWIGGPPLGFFLIDRTGFHWLYTITACVYLITGFSSIIVLRGIHAPPIEAQKHHEKFQIFSDPKLILGVLGISLLYGTNHSYLIAMPLHLRDNLQVSSLNAGALMGTAAALEIPIMILAGWLGTRFPLLPLIRIGAFSAIAFQFGVWHADKLWQLFILQLLNASFIGFVAGLGITWFQNQMPDRLGSASALYLNCSNIGYISGSLTIAVVAQIFSYHTTFIVNAGICAVAATALLFIPVTAQKTTAQNPA